MPDRHPGPAPARDARTAQRLAWLDRGLYGALGLGLVAVLWELRTGRALAGPWAGRALAVTLAASVLVWRRRRRAEAALGRRPSF